MASERFEQNLRRHGKYVAAGGGLLLALANSTSSSAAKDSPDRLSQQPIPSHTEYAAKPHHPKLVFDDLGGGSPKIQVYPGVKSNSHDKQSNGYYHDGHAVEAECKTTGRKVSSHPELGETKRSSQEWVRIDSGSQEVQYATAVYIENPAQLLRKLKHC